MKPLFETAGVVLYHGDCREIMAALPGGGFDAIVTDPPYGLEFMGKEWDKLGAANEAATDSPGWRAGHGGRGKPSSTNGVPFGGAGQRVRYGTSAASMQPWHFEWATTAIRVAKPGAHLLAFGGTRTYHRLACAIEDAGFELRDCIMYMFGTGFPKSMDVSKQIDKQARAKRKVVGDHPHAAKNKHRSKKSTYGTPNQNTTITTPATDAAKQWHGFGTALKPAYEPVIVARSPLSEKTVAANVLKHGTGAINIDGCRVPVNGEKAGGSGKPPLQFNGENHRPFHDNPQPREFDRTTGRWPANVIIDDSPEIMEEFARCGESVSTGALRHINAKPKSVAKGAEYKRDSYGHDDSSTPARFFYTAKASRRERGEANNHPTVKPLSLMRYLCRLVCPPGGIILDPFAGSGTTGIAAMQEGMRAVLIEQSREYCEIIVRRLKEHAAKEPLRGT
ncbi:MAG: site-specific DNA-methyltransferase [Patescibacteria group bacterium]|nr:site-specific DNA-methyltransferase [Patescibacteria group bacterium]